MKKILLFIMFSIFSLIACKKENNEEKGCEYPQQTTQKILTGTFVQLFGKDDWSEAQWDEFLTEIKDVGMNTLIVQYTAFKNPSNDITWFNSANTFTATKSKNTLQRLLASAGRKAIEVHIGLHFDDTYWHHQTDVAWLQTQANHCIAIAEEIQAQFGTHAAFKGWYIPHEPEPNAYNTDEKVRLFREQFIDRISNRLHQLNNKPVSIAAFWNSSLSTPEQLKHFMAELSKSNLQIIMLQDGVGAQHVTLNRLANYYEAAQRGLFEENKNYKGVFWSDLETFASPNGEYPFEPATFDRVKQQLETALSIPKVSKIVSFHYFDDMSTKSSHKAKADALREAYKNYIKERQFNIIEN